MSQPDVNTVLRPRAPGEVDAFATQYGEAAKNHLIAQNLHARRRPENGYNGFLTEEEARFLLKQLGLPNA